MSVMFKTACPVHHTALSEASWDAGANVGRLPSPMTVAVARRMYALYDGDQVDNGEIVKAACSLPHHEVSGEGQPGAANLAACRNALARLNQVQGYSAADKDAAERHLQAHLADQPGREGASMLERMVVPIEWKGLDDPDLPDEWKQALAADEANTLVGYASTFGNVDLGGDVVMRGAFTNTIENIKANGIPLLADHMAVTSSVLGTIYDAMENRKGLLIAAKISGAPSAQDTAMKAREGHLNRMSIGYETVAEDWVEKDGARVRQLKEIKLWETSVVVFPMNPEAVIAGVKSIVSAATEHFYPAESKLRDDVQSSLSTIDVWRAELAIETKYLSSPQTPEGSAVKAPEGPPASPPEEKPNTDEGVSVWDTWTSQAMLAGRPVGEADSVTRARLLTELELNESGLAGD